MQLRAAGTATLTVIAALSGVSPVSWADLEVLGNKVATKKYWRTLKIQRAKVLTRPPAQDLLLQASDRIGGYCVEAGLHAAMPDEAL